MRGESGAEGAGELERDGWSVSQVQRRWIEWYRDVIHAWVDSKWKWCDYGNPDIGRTDGIRAAIEQPATLKRQLLYKFNLNALCSETALSCRSKHCHSQLCSTKWLEIALADRAQLAIYFGTMTQHYAVLRRRVRCNRILQIWQLHNTAPLSTRGRSTSAISELLAKCRGSQNNPTT